MIDNPLEQQTLETYDSLYINEKFEEHCSDAAKELAKDNNLHPDYYEPFIEFYIEECRESDRGYFFGDQKYIIDLWWDHNKYLYNTKTPYMEIKKMKTRLEEIRDSLDQYIKDELEKSPGHRDWEVFSFEDDLYEIIESFDEIINYDPTP